MSLFLSDGRRAGLPLRVGRVAAGVVPAIAVDRLADDLDAHASGPCPRSDLRGRLDARSR